MKRILHDLPFFGLLLVAVLAVAIRHGAIAAPAPHADYWDAHGCINHLDGSRYEATADKLEEFNPQDICKEYVHIQH